MIKFLPKLSHQYQPLTTVGFTVLLLGVALLIGPARVAEDIVATVIGWTLVGWLMLNIAALVANAAALRNGLHLDFAESEGSFEAQSLLECRAGKPFVLILRLTRPGILPLFTLRLNLKFKNPGVETVTHMLRGRAGQATILKEIIVFPHRGNWRYAAMRARLGDPLGLSALEWDLSNTNFPVETEVLPRAFVPPNTPILTSSERPGDVLTSTHVREGDPYDIKPYHPSDGMRRILWKIYAKTGQLLSRHPEAALTPEGHLVAYALAAPLDDHVAEQVLDYLKRAEALQLELFFQCEGSRQSEPARSSKKARDLLLSSVWNVPALPDPLTLGQARDFLQSTQNSLGTAHLRRVLIFLATERLASEGHLDSIVAILEEVERSGAEPVVFTAQADHLIDPQSLRSQGARTSWRHKLRNILQENPKSGLVFPGLYRDRFLEVCASRKWHVIL